MVFIILLLLLFFIYLLLMSNLPRAWKIAGILRKMSHLHRAEMVCLVRFSACSHQETISLGLQLCIYLKYFISFPFSILLIFPCDRLQHSSELLHHGKYAARTAQWHRKQNGSIIYSALQGQAHRHPDSLPVKSVFSILGTQL